MWKRVHVFVSGGALVLVVVGFMAFFACNILNVCGTNECTDVRLADAPSPDGKFLAVKFERTCTGLNVDAHTVSLYAAGEAFDADLESARVYTVMHGQDIEVSWKSIGKLQIGNVPARTPLFQRTKWQDIEVEYGKAAQK